MTGSRCVVLGATGGIGRQVVVRMARLGYEVHGVARRAEPLTQLSAEARCVTHEVDLLDRDRWERALETIGDIDVLVFAAGVGGVLTPFAAADRSHIDHIIGSNVIGLLNSVHAALPSMIDRGSGDIVIVGSIAGLYPTPSPAYAASKGATHSFAQALSSSLGASGVRVTEICPGRVNTDCVPLANPGLDVRALEPDPRILLQPEDVADAVVWAISMPPRVHIGLIEMMPSNQVIAGSRFVESQQNASQQAKGTNNER
jgi:3-hydroxy acid dehydrogenase/malonic semialdehyde reductase